MKKKSLQKFCSLYCIISVMVACNQSPNKPGAGADGVKSAKSLELYLPDDLQATLWAESPMLYNPTNLDVDSKGRIWITEAVNYRNFRNDSTKFVHRSKGDRVIILEDTNGDGIADSSRVFVQDEDLISPVGIAVIGNKVIVSCSPNLIIYTDENGDDHPDKKEILLTGFGGKDHDHSLHAVYAGPDGHWYFNAGNAGPHIVKDKSGWTLRSGSIYIPDSAYGKDNKGNMKSDDGNIWVGGLALRINPDGTGLKVLGHNFRNSYEVIPDSYGNLWQNDNDDQVVTCRTSWLMEGGNAGYFSSDGTRFWQADQRPGQDIFSAHWHQDDPGVMPAGDRSGSGAPTGIVVNESDALGEKYFGMLLSADAGRNVIFGYTPKIVRSGFDLGKRTNFITSLTSDNEGYVWNDTAQNKLKEKWFRPSDVTIGTDGSIYIADWYDPVVGGHQMQDTVGYGRIYRIVPKNKKLTPPKIDLNTVEGQLQALRSPAINVRNAGFVRLRLQGEPVVDKVSSLLSDGNAYVRARAIYLLSQVGEKGKKKVEELLQHKEELLRATAFRALRHSTPDIIPYAQKMAGDPSSFVRREVAVSLMGLPYRNTKDILLEIAKRYDGEDRWYLETLGATFKGHEAEAYSALKKIFAPSTVSASQWNKQMTGFAWRLHPVESITDLRSRALDSSLPQKERQAAITALAFINSRTAVNDMVNLSRSPLKDVSESAAYWLSFRQSNDWYHLLDWTKLNINTEYERKLARMKVKQQIILDERQSINERKHRVNEMARDSVGGQLLIGLAVENKLPSVLVPFVEQTIFQNPNSTIRAQASNLFKRPGSNKSYSLEKIAAIPGDATKGKTVFSSSCASCHKVANTGNNVGPDLTSISKKFNKTELLDAIINPSAAIVFGYEPWLVNTKDGESFYGFLISDNNRAIVLKDIAGQKHSIPVERIKSKKKDGKSLMPDPISNGLSEQNLADIVQFLSEK